MIIVCLAILGLVFGSFVNALVWRTHEKKSVVHGRSMCPHCRHELAPADLIPVLSWLMLGGRCRYCKKPISVQYPLVELTVAGLFGLSYSVWPRQLVNQYEYVYFGLWLAALVILTALAVYDLKWMQLPDKFNWPFVLSGVLSVAVLVQLDFPASKEKLIGAALLWGFFAVLYFGSGGRWLGGGDLKYALGMGLWLGWRLGLVGLMIAFYAACLVVVPLLLVRRIKRRQPVPFGPFLIAGTVIGLLFGQDLIDWYSSTFLYIS